jgi:hypothetical protein
MTFGAILIVLVAGTAGVLVVIGRAISAANFGRHLRAARVSAPARSPAEHGSVHAGDLGLYRAGGDSIRG